MGGGDFDLDLSDDEKTRIENGVGHARLCGRKPTGTFCTSSSTPWRYLFKML